MTRTLLLALLLASTTVAAQPAKPSPSPAPGATPNETMTDAQKTAAAKALYDKGINHYNLGEFDQAIDAFKQAYSLSSAPGLLFNIAQAYRLKKDYENATYFYSTYLRLQPDAPNRGDVEARLREMKQMLDDQKKLVAKPPTGTLPPEGPGTTTTATTPTTTTPTTTTPATTPTSTPPTAKPATVTASLTEGPDQGEAGKGEHPGRPLVTAGIATAAAGGALLVTGIIFGRMAAGAASDLNQLNATGGTWTQAEQDRYDAGSRDNTIAIVSFVVGGAAVAAGGVLWFLGHSKEAAPSVALVPTRGGAYAAAGWSF
jgi:tetratricopeptide (TPR) repeat protein